MFEGGWSVKHKILLISRFLVVKLVHRSWFSHARVAGVLLLNGGFSASA